MKKREIKLTPVKNLSLSEEVTNKLRQVILNGSIKSGERIIEEGIAAMLEISRGPVRDALLALEQEGLIMRERNRGAVVVTMATQDVEEVWSLRIALEMLALRYAMKKATEEDLARMEKIAAEISACMKTDFSLERAVDLDLKFHEQLVNISGHRRLISYWEDLRTQIWFLIFSRNIDDIETFRKRSRIYHKEIIDVIRQRDLAKGSKLLKKHLENSYADLVTAYKQTERNAER